MVQLFIVKGSNECEQAKQSLLDAGIDFSEVDVRENGSIAHLTRDLHVSSIPVLVTPDQVIEGASEIAKFSAHHKNTPANSQ